MPDLNAAFLDYLSGRRRGPVASAVRSGLTALSLPYRLCTGARRALYEWGFLISRELGARVVSVGNITTGGTGKTPLVVWIARWLQQRNIPTAVLSRGYGARPPGGAGETDETLLFRRLLPKVPHLIGKNRLAMGRQAVERHGVECVVLDDGFQHLAIGRDLDIVLVDSLMPFGFERLLPRGLLREPPTCLRRADLLVFTRCDLCPRDDLRALHRRVREICGPRPIVESAHRPARFYRHLTEESRPLGWVKGRRIYAFSALGNPDAFPRTLETLGAEVLGHRRFRDHHWYREAELDRIAQAAAEAGADAIVTTEKDAVKIPAWRDPAPPLYVLAIEIAFLQGEELLVEALGRVIKA